MEKRQWAEKSTGALFVSSARHATILCMKTLLVLSGCFFALLTSWADELPKLGDANFPMPAPSERHTEKVASVKSGDYDLVMIGDQLADGKQVFWLDLTEVFLRADSTINTDLMWDLLHPSPKGAEAWAKAVESSLSRLMGGHPLPANQTWPDRMHSNGIPDS